MRRIATLALAGLALAACEGPDIWDKPGATQADFQRDAYECERDARMSAMSFGGGIAGAIEAKNFYRRCMVAHGYTLRQNSSATASPTYTPPPPDPERAIVTCLIPGQPPAALTVRSCRGNGGKVVGDKRYE